MDNRKLVKKGRYGDTHIRDVYGIKSHVNKLEADIIDNYGFLGESFVESTGSGTINPYTGLPEYHGGSPTLTDWLGHPAHHGEQWIDWGGGPQYDDTEDNPPPGEGVSAHVNLEEIIKNALDIEDEDYRTVGDEGFGMQDVSSADFLGKSPEKLAEWIIKTKYHNNPPAGVTKEWLMQTLEDTMPQLQPVSQEDVGFAKERLGKDVYSLQGAAGQVGQAMQSVYGGSGVGMRAGMTGEKAIKKGFGQAQTGFKEEMYGLGQKQEASWDEEWKSLLGSLPSPIPSD